jgi:hypothetical protein
VRRGSRAGCCRTTERDQHSDTTDRAPAGHIPCEATGGVGRQQTALASYLVATRRFEWHGSNAGSGDDPPTSSALATLERDVRAQAVRASVGTAAGTELLVSLDALTADRRARLADASREAPSLYVITLAVSAIALIANASALTIRSGWRAAILVSGLVSVVALSMALLFALGTPWRGAITVSGHPIDAVIRDLANGYFHR